MKRPKPEIPSSVANRLRGVASKMLDRLEQALDEGDEALASQKRYEWLFGSKVSLAATLVTLSELVLKLDASESKPIDATEVTQPMSDADVTLVESFIRKMQPDNKL